MKIKYILKQVLGEEYIYWFKRECSYIRMLPHSATIKQRIQVSPVHRNTISVLQEKKQHLFCGYFDIAPDNPFCPSQILIHRLSPKAIAGKNTIDICVADIATQQIQKIASSSAWCWQMGARARWSKQRNKIYFNDYQDGQYCCRIFDIENRLEIDRIPYAFYDISADEKIGLSVNFSRLQRLRPGYGYNNIADHSKGVIAPADDGLFLVDINRKSAELLTSYAELDNLLPVIGKGENYINHVAISPDSKKAMFFYIWKSQSRPGWTATLWIIDLRTRELHCLEKEDQVSHYTWKNDHILLITGIRKNTRESFYRYYDINLGLKEDINDDALKRDGHPTFSRISNAFYSDTYPDSHCHQIFFKYENGIYTPILRLYHDPRMDREKRCDLHPHYFYGSERVALDTTFTANKRSVLIVDMKH